MRKIYKKKIRICFDCKIDQSGTDLSRQEVNIRNCNGPGRQHMLMLFLPF